MSEGSEWYKTEMMGVNRIGFRYIPAGINPPGCASPCRTIESNPTCFRVSWEDRSPYLKVTKDGLNLAGSKGFRSARCNAPIREGKWYMEVKVMHGGGEHVGEESRCEGSHVRLGWARREAPLNGPAGLDGYSYGYRDKTGEKVTLSRPRPYGQPFGTGDVVGMYISLPPLRKPNPKDPHDPAHLKRERIPIDLKGQEVFELLEYPPSKEMMALVEYSGKMPHSGSLPSSNKKSTNGKLPERGGPTQPGTKIISNNLRPLPVLHGSRIAFFVNGKCQGTAFQDIYDYLPLRQTDMQRKANSRKKTREKVKEHRENPFDDGTLGYYPFISLFNEAAVRLNPGPDFEFPPPDDVEVILDQLSEKQVLTGSKGVESSQQAFVPPFPNTYEQHLKPKEEPVSDSNIIDHTPWTKRSWRPAIERYPEFMQEEWAFDAREEEVAKAELAKQTKLQLVEEEKKKQKEKKKQQADARKRARMEAPDKISKDLKEEEERERIENKDGNPLGLHGPGMPGSLYQLPSHVHFAHSPSPLRYYTSSNDRQEQKEPIDSHDDQEQEHYHEPESEVNSPAATYASYGGGQSGYTSENNQDFLHEHDHETDNDNDMDVDHELEALLA